MSQEGLQWVCTFLEIFQGKLSLGVVEFHTFQYKICTFLGVNLKGCRGLEGVKEHKKTILGLMACFV